MMKKFVIFVVVVALAGGAWFFTRGAADSTAEAPVEPVRSLPPPTSTNANATEVFQRAFWKRPTENDKILHAERREWADGDGVDRWQWFIVVDPSAELAGYLHEQNPFGMSAPKEPVVLPSEQVPEWFPKSADGFVVQQTSDRQMIFLLEADSGRLFATSQGRGFAKAVERPVAAPKTSAQPPGRLPTSPPPQPNRP